MSDAAQLDRLTPELLERYDRPGPRYTSYPTAPHFSDTFDEPAYQQHLAEAAQRPNESLSMYVHLPFCHQRCSYCGCNSVISPHRGPEEGYLTALEQELELLASALGQRRRLSQLHWGGGTPTYLTPAQCERLATAITSRFPLEDNAEVAIEIDPTVTSFEHLSTLRRLGFNRISMGLQDIDPKVQAAVNRRQSLALTRDHVEESRRLGFSSVNIDLIYGLPLQTEASFRSTIATVISELTPDRIACFSFAHVPWIKPHQRSIDATLLPQGWEKMRLFIAAASQLLEAGYRFIGFDHFARPTDDLASALDQDRIHRSFMGYTVLPATDQVGVGMTSIGDVAGAYIANTKSLAKYEAALHQGKLPVERGVERSPDDELRGSVIRRIICTLNLDYSWAEETLGIHPPTAFPDAFAKLVAMEEDGLIELGDHRLQVTTLGRFFLRNICMPFDAYLRPSGTGPRYSRTV